MKLNDVRLLWGRSGNRCAFPNCHMEMTVGGSKTTIGEIAHIVAKSVDGPRGNNPLPLEQRDEYDNLILLCPTHHKLIDDNEDKWSVSLLKEMKADHEGWVTTQLEGGRISVRVLNGEDFLTNRIQELVKSFANAIWVYSALTPLSVTDEAINPKSREIVDSVSKTCLPPNCCGTSVVNRYYTRPSEFGLLNEDIRQLAQGMGHRIEVFRNGHIEMMICFEGASWWTTSVIQGKRGEGATLGKLIHFITLRECLESEAEFLARTWKVGLPFYNMIFSTVLTDTEGSMLVHPSSMLPYLSYPARSSPLRFTRVVDRQTSADELLYSGLERAVESYGWTLPSLKDNDGKPSTPQTFVTK
jgi:hypothetical protein